MDFATLLSAVPTAGLLGEWKLDGNLTDTKNGLNATMSVSPVYIGAQIGQGLDLTGNGSGGQGVNYAEMPLDSRLNDLAEGAAYSISAWLNPDTAPSGTDPSKFWMVVGKTNSQAIGIVYNMAQKFAARHYLDGNVLELATATSTSALNQWHHVVAVVVNATSTASGSLKLYVDGQLSNTDTWAAGTPAKDFGTTAKWRIGKSDTDWSANGRVDQVRFYNLALTQTDVTSLFEETASAPIFRFPVGMAKDQDSDLGTDAFFYNPDGKRNAVGVSMLPTLRYARQHGARVIMTVTGADNQPGAGHLANLDTTFNKAEWTSRFDNAAAAISPDTVRNYLEDGTLIGIYVIDEPWSDFKGFTYLTLDSLCQHVHASWPWAPCIARTDNTVIDANTPSVYTYNDLDAGWAQITDFKRRNSSTPHTAQSYYEDQLAAGKKHGLGLWYGFNLLDYVRADLRPGCGPLFFTNKCPMNAADITAVADAIEAIDANGGVNGVKGCGVSGWYLEKDAGDMRNYFLIDVNTALRYLWNHTAGRNPAIQPGPCNIRGDLPAP